MNNEEAVYEIDLLQLFHVLRRRIATIIVVTLIFGIGAWAYSSFVITPMYTAETLLYVENKTEGTTSVTQGDLYVAKDLVKTYGVIITSRTTLDEVIKESGVNYKYEELEKMVTSAPIDDTQVFSVKVTCDDPVMAAKIANTIAKVLPKKISDVIEDSSLAVVDKAVIPKEPSSPNILKNTLLGLILGFIIVCAYIIIRHLLDNKVHDDEYLIRTYDLPILAVIPDLTRKTSKSAYYSADQSNESGRRGRHGK